MRSPDGWAWGSRSVLVVGAPIGGVLLAWLHVRLSPARLPDGLDWPAIGGVAPLKGIGFTVAIFISVLAFDDEALRQEAKLAILLASLVAGIVGLTVLHTRHRLLSRRDRRPARTPASPALRVPYQFRSSVWPSLAASGP